MNKVVLLDIEGTTTPINFVHEILFPFAKERIGSFVLKNKERLGSEIDQLVIEASEDESFEKGVTTIEEVIEYAEYLIDVDRKSTPLKSIQGMIWEEGYENGELHSVVFDDVPEAFERWKGAGMKTAIYSSGSVKAQKLLFAYSDKGDLTPFISAYFDTNTGNKKETVSYLNIIDELGIETSEAVFISDSVDELVAAKNAGVTSILSIRPGNAEVSSGIGFRAIETFEELNFE